MQLNCQIRWWLALLDHFANYSEVSVIAVNGDRDHPRSSGAPLIFKTCLLKFVLDCNFYFNLIFFDIFNFDYFLDPRSSEPAKVEPRTSEVPL